MLSYVTAVTTKWLIIGQKRHAVAKLKASGAVLTACGQLIHRSASDRKRSEAPDCYPCQAVTGRA